MQFCRIESTLKTLPRDQERRSLALASSLPQSKTKRTCVTKQFYLHVGLQTQHTPTHSHSSSNNSTIPQTAPTLPPSLRPSGELALDGARNCSVSAFSSPHMCILKICTEPPRCECANVSRWEGAANKTPPEGMISGKRIVDC